MNFEQAGALVFRDASWRWFHRRSWRTAPCRGPYEDLRLGIARMIVATGLR